MTVISSCGMSGCLGHCERCRCRFAGSLCFGPPCGCGSQASTVAHNMLQSVFNVVGLPAAAPKPLPKVTAIKTEIAGWFETLQDRAGEDLDRVGEGNARVIATLDNGEEFVLFRFYSDELSFTYDDLVGKTIQEARDVKYKKDLAYLRSP